MQDWKRLKCVTAPLGVSRMDESEPVLHPNLSGEAVKNPKQMTISITGPAGIGKSKVAASLYEYFKLSGKSVILEDVYKDVIRASSEPLTFDDADVVIHTDNSHD
jgi:adenylylsulfate kinase-like enzyme